MRSSILILAMSIAFTAFMAIDVAGFCCGESGCNIFGCNCDCNAGCALTARCGQCFAETGQHNWRGCAITGRRRRDTAQIAGQGLDANGTFVSIDKSGDGSINMDEAIKFIVAQKKSNKSAEELKKDPKWFQEIDKNHDGKIQPKEMDENLEI